MYSKIKPYVQSSYLALIILLVIVLIEVSWLSLARYIGYNARMFDLGLMNQAVWSGTQGQPLIFMPEEGYPISSLAWHMQLIYFAFVPFYAIFSTPKTLLILQSLLYVGGGWAIYRIVKRHHAKSSLALGATALYLFYPIIQTAVLFDFHGDTVAMPFLLLTVEALDRKAWRTYTLWLILALGCKLYVALPILVLGFIIWRQGERKIGLLTMVGAIFWGLFAFFVIRSWFPAPETGQLQASTVSYLSHYFGELEALRETLPIRAITAIIVFGPALWLAWRSPWWLVAAGVTAIPALLSTGPGASYDYRYHHYALAGPFLVLGMIYGLQKTNRPALHLGISLGLVLLFNSLFVDSPLNLRFYNPPPGSATGLDNSQYGITDRDAFKDDWLSQYVPAEVPLVVDTVLAPHLSNREVVYLSRYPGDVTRTLPDYLPDVDYVVIDSLFDFVIGRNGLVTTGGVLYEQEAIAHLLQTDDFGLMQADDGMLLFKRNAPGLEQSITRYEENPNLEPLAVFGDGPVLLEAIINPLGQNQFELTYRWQASSALKHKPPLVGITHVDGLPHSRIVHLPSQTLMPTPTWPDKVIVVETITFALPANTPAGSYPLGLSWYDSSSIFASETDARSRIGDVFKVGEVRVP